MTDNHHNDPEHNDPEHTDHAVLTTGRDATEPAGLDDGVTEHDDDRDGGQAPAQHLFRVGDRVVRWLAPESVMRVLDLATCDDRHPVGHSEVDQADIDSAGSHPRLKVLDAHGNETWLYSREVRPVATVANRKDLNEDSADETSADSSTLGADRGEPDAESGGAGSPDAGASDGRDAASQVRYAVVDPRELRLGPNVRTNASLTKEFVASIRDRGVQEPITVRRRDEDGALVVRKGSRRTLAALEAGLAAVPVLIQPDADPGERGTDGQVERIIDQVEENDQRAANTAAEQIGAVQQLLDLGLSAPAIARRTHRRPKVVKAQAKVARSTLLAAAVARYDGLTLDRAAAAAEFDDGTEEGVEAVKALIVTAQKRPTQFDHVLQRLQDQRRQRQLLAGTLAKLASAGVRVVPEEEADRVTAITGLRPSAADESGTELTEQAHRGCPGHAALVTIKPGWGGRPDEVITKWVCTDPETHGHRARFDGPNSATGAGVGGGVSVAGVDGSRRMTEQEKAERRIVVANNKDWDSATTVRRRWLRETFLPRRTAPKNAHQFIAATLARGGHPLRKAMESRHLVGCELLGLPAPGGWGAEQAISTQVENAAPARATMLTLAVLLGAAEQSVGRHTWRNPDTEAIAYFTALQHWGYPLSLVEQLILGITTATSAETTPGTGESPNGTPAHPIATATSGGTEDTGTEPNSDTSSEPEPEGVGAADPDIAVAGEAQHGPGLGSHHEAADDADDDAVGEAAGDAAADGAATDRAGGDGAGGEEDAHSHAA